MAVYLIYESDSSNGSLRDAIAKKFGEEKCFTIETNLFFVKADVPLNEIMEAAGFNDNKKITGFAVEAERMNGWYNVSLWDWQKK